MYMNYVCELNAFILERIPLNPRVYGTIMPFPIYHGIMKFLKDRVYYIITDYIIKYELLRLKEMLLRLSIISKIKSLDQRVK